MSDLQKAAEGAIALVCGGFIFLLYGSVLETPFIDLSFYGILYVLGGALLLITVVAVLTGKLISGVA